MEQNKIVKYLKYAIGEIILITIGILIAVQINSFKTYQNDRVTEKKLLIKLKSDLQSDTSDLNDLLQLKKRQTEECIYMLELFNDPHKNISDTSKYVLSVIEPLVDYPVDNPNRTIFELAKSSGELFTINNDTLVKAITVYFTDDKLYQHLSTVREYVIRSYFIATEYYPGTPYRWTTQVIHDYLADFRMESMYYAMESSYKTEIPLIIEKKEKAIQLMEQIDNQILQMEK